MPAFITEPCLNQTTLCSEVSACTMAGLFNCLYFGLKQKQRTYQFGDQCNSSVGIVKQPYRTPLLVDQRENKNYKTLTWGISKNRTFLLNATFLNVSRRFLNISKDTQLFVYWPSEIFYRRARRAASLASWCILTGLQCFEMVNRKTIHEPNEYWCAAKIRDWICGDETN